MASNRPNSTESPVRRESAPELISSNAKRACCRRHCSRLRANASAYHRIESASGTPGGGYSVPSVKIFQCWSASFLLLGVYNYISLLSSSTTYVTFSVFELLLWCAISWCYTLRIVRSLLGLLPDTKLLIPRSYYGSYPSSAIFLCSLIFSERNSFAQFSEPREYDWLWEITPSRCVTVSIL